MIIDQTIGSARAEKPKDPVARHVLRNLMTALLAAALMLPSLAAVGMESLARQPMPKPVDILPLPPIPYLESTLWMKQTSAPTLRIDTLTSPRLTPRGVLEAPQDRAKASPTFS